jgi:hypothetical protein
MEIGVHLLQPPKDDVEQLGRIAADVIPHLRRETPRGAASSRPW